MQSVAEPFIRLRAISHLEHGRIVILAGGIGQPFVTTDYPSVQRALELEADALLVAKRGIDAVYDKDPNLHADARRYDRLTYEEAIRMGIRVMDTSAFVLAGEQHLTMHVFDVGQGQLMKRICQGENIGTLSRADPVVPEYFQAPIRGGFSQPVSDPELLIARGVAVVIHDGRVLVVRRRRAGRVYAVLPGGHVEPGEWRADTAVRELAEETTLRAKIARLLWTRDGGGRSASYYLMRDVMGTPILAGEEAERHTTDNSYELVWAQVTDLDAFNLQPLEIRAPLGELMTTLGRTSC